MMAGALGTAARMGLSNFIAERYGPAFPTGTLIVNVTGCFVIGLFFALTGPSSAFVAPPLVRQTVMIGFLGGYTTFSSFSLQTLDLLRSGHTRRALLNVTASVVLCVGAVALGHLLASHLNGGDPRIAQIEGEELT